MKKYLLGLLRNFFNPAVSIFALIDNLSTVDRRAKVYKGVKVFNSNIGRYTYVCRNTGVVCADVGQFCSIAGGSAIGMGTHPLKNLSTSSLFISSRNATGHSWTKSNTFEEYKRIAIGNDVWIGGRVMVMGGVKIGHGAVIGAGAIVTRDIPDYAIAVGIPAKVIKYRFDQSVIDELLKLKWWDLPEEKLISNIKYFQSNNINLDALREIIAQ